MNTWLGFPPHRAGKKVDFHTARVLERRAGKRGRKPGSRLAPQPSAGDPGEAEPWTGPPARRCAPRGAPHAVLPRAGRHSPSRSHLLPPLRPRHRTAGSRDCPPSSETENTVLRFDKQRDSQLRQKRHRGAGPGRSTAAGRKRSLVHVIFPRRDVFFPLSVQKASAQPSADLTPQENSASIPSQAAVVENF